MAGRSAAAAALISGEVMVSRRYQEKDFDQLSFVMAGHSSRPCADQVRLVCAPGHDGGGKEKPRPCGRGLNFRYGESVQSRWPSSCSSSVNRLMKFKYSDSAPVIAARSATAPPCEA